MLLWHPVEDRHDAIWKEHLPKFQRDDQTGHSEQCRQRRHGLSPAASIERERTANCESHEYEEEDVGAKIGSGGMTRDVRKVVAESLHRALERQPPKLERDEAQVRSERR